MSWVLSSSTTELQLDTNWSLLPCLFAECWSKTGRHGSLTRTKRRVILERYSSGTEVYPRQRPSLRALDSYSLFGMQGKAKLGSPASATSRLVTIAAHLLRTWLSLFVQVDTSPAPSPIVCSYVPTKRTTEIKHARKLPGKLSKINTKTRPQPIMELFGQPYGWYRHRKLRL